MEVHVFAGLKDHFEKEFQIDSHIETADDLKRYLIGLRPETANMLDSCRIAVNDEFIDMNFKLKSNDIIAIIPPSSGG